jgi:hypothetical protein
MARHLRVLSAVLIALLSLSVATEADAQRIRIRGKRQAPVVGGGGGPTNCIAVHASGKGCIWLDTETLTLLTTKTTTQPYIDAIAAADAMVAASNLPTLTISSITNHPTAPVVTIVEDVPWSTTANIYIGRGQNLTGSGGGDWTNVNFDYPTGGTIVATKTGTKTFTIPLNTSGNGVYTNQKIGLFARDFNFSEGLAWFGNAFNLGFAYRTTGTTNYCTKGAAYLRWMAGLGVAGLVAPIAVDAGYPARGAPAGLALAFDWCYDSLTSQDKIDAGAACALWYDYFNATSATANGPASNNYFGGYVYGFGLCGITMNGVTARGQEINDAIRTKFNTIIEVSFATGGEMQDGPIMEGYTYGGQHWGSILRYLEAIRTATGENVAATSAVPAALATNMIYSLKPNMWQFNDDNDYAGDCTGMMDPNLVPVIIKPLVGRIEGEYLQYFYQNIVGDPYGGCTPVESWMRMMWYDASRTATNYTTALPTTWFARGNEKMHWRTAWNDASAVWATMQGEVFYSGDLAHANRGAGHFSVQRGSDYFLVNTNQWRDTNGAAGMPSFFNAQRTQGMNTFMNTLSHFDGGVYTFTGGSYNGGQGDWACGGCDETRHEENIAGGWAYEKSTLWPAYCMNDFCAGSSHTLTDYDRSVMFQGAGVFTLYDRAVDRTTGYTNKDVWQINKAATVSGPSTGMMTYTLGTSKMFLKAILPGGTLPTLTQTENSCNDFITPSMCNGGVPYNFTHRLEVTDPSPTANYRMLTGICVTSSGAATPTIDAIASTGNTMYGMSVAGCGSLTAINLYSADGSDQTGVTYSAVCTGTGRHIIGDLQPTTQYTITQGGAVIATRVSSTARAISFDSSGCSGSFVVAASTNVLNTTKPTPERYAGMTAPVSGETFIAPADLRLMGEGLDRGFSGCGVGCTDGFSSASLKFYANDTLLATVLRSPVMGVQEFSSFKTRVAGLAAGTYGIWSRATYDDGTYLDSPVRTITVIAAPTYNAGASVTLSADIDITGQAYSKVGTAGSRIKIDCAGFQILGTPTSFTLDYVDVFNCGSRNVTTSSENGIDLTTTGAVSITNSRFYGNDTIAFTVNTGGSCGFALATNTFASNSNFQIGQNPDTTDTANGHGSYPSLYLAGTCTAAKTITGNNIGAGFFDLRAASTTVGGSTSALGNVFTGPRVGVHLTSPFSGSFSHNLFWHIYYNGLSQGDILELGSISGLTIEHNVIIGSSWPVRYLASEFRYNYLAADGAEGIIWTNTSGTANIHHNVIRGVFVTKGMIYRNFVSGTTLVRNNTFDLVDKTDTGNLPIDFRGGTTTLNSNLFLHNPTPAVESTGATLTADYNDFYDSEAGNKYNPNITPANDAAVNPTLTGLTLTIPWNVTNAWLRTKTVAQILADIRAAYLPTAGVIDNGDTGTYGAGNDKGAVGAGTSNASDLLGTTTP